jgi:hypothetical protein
MAKMFKILAVLVIISMNVDIFGPSFRPVPTRLELPRPGMRHIKPEGPNYQLRTVLLVMTMAAVTFFVVDAFRRVYPGPRARALAFALGGYFSLGLSSLIYYLFWGWRPIQPAGEIYGAGEFCASCISASSGQAAPDTEMYEIGVGSVLLGNAEQCAMCKSRVKTLWAWYVVPLCPLGSYRVIPTAMGKYVGRRTDLCWRQVLGVYIVGLTLCGPILLWLFGAISFSR